MNVNFNPNLGFPANGIEFPAIDFPDIESKMPLSFEKEAAPTKGFADLLKDAVDKVNTQHDKALDMAVGFAAGAPYDTHQVMIEAAKAESMLNLASQVTSRVAQSYQTLMNMQI